MRRNGSSGNLIVIILCFLIAAGLGTFLFWSRKQNQEISAQLKLAAQQAESREAEKESSEARRMSSTESELQKASQEQEDSESGRQTEKKTEQKPENEPETDRQEKGSGSMELTAGKTEQGESSAAGESSESGRQILVSGSSSRTGTDSGVLSRGFAASSAAGSDQNAAGSVATGTIQSGVFSGTGQ